MGVRSARDSRHRITVLYNPENQGYGGNQKLGYQYAIRHGFDVVVLLHGDGQYAPEAIPTLLAPMLDGAADAVMGSRMLVPGVARQGGMPLYKFVGNKILTFLQNRLLGSQPVGVPLRLSRLPRRGAREDPVRVTTRTSSTSTPRSSSS